MGEVMHYVEVASSLLGFFHHFDAEDESVLWGGLHHFELVTKKWQHDSVGARVDLGFLS